jgi:hypothetical protein
LDFGLTLGARPWYSGSSPIIGGQPITPIWRNTVSGCAVNVNCDTAQFIKYVTHTLSCVVADRLYFVHLVKIIDMFVSNAIVSSKIKSVMWPVNCLIVVNQMLN